MSDVSPEQEKRMISRFWTWFFRSQTLQFSLLFLLLLAFGTFVGILLSECIETYVSGLLGLYQKNEVLKFLGISMGGILVALQALMSYKRAKALEDTAKTQADAAKDQARATEEQATANKLTEQGLRQERLKSAIEHLGHKSDSVRLGGAYELFHLAEESEEMREAVFDILCAHIRRTTSENEYRKTYGAKPSEEVQSLLSLLFVKEYEVFKGLYTNLSGTWLNGSDLWRARLENASLIGAYLQGAYLVEAHLQGASLVEAHLQGASLDEAHLQTASFDHAYLQGASFDGAHLQVTILNDAHLQGASLIGAHLQEASLIETDLRGARSHESHHELTETMRELIEGRDFKKVIMRSINQESDLSGAIFGGGLSQKDCDAFVRGLSDEIANKLREKLAPHIGKPKSNKLPKDSCADTGSYTKEDAEQWIAEYEQAMSGVPGDDS